MIKSALSALLLFGALGAFSQAKYEADTKTIESTLKACLETISIKKGEEVDWNRFENLFLSSATLGVTYTKNDTARHHNWQPSDFKKVTQYGTTGFHEYQLGLRVDQFGNVANAFQTFGMRYSDDQPELGRGINAYQLVYKEGRWWVANLIWAQEGPKLALPNDFIDTK